MRKFFFSKADLFGRLALFPEADLHQPRSRHEVACDFFCARNTVPLCGRREGGAFARRGEWKAGRSGDGERGR